MTKIKSFGVIAMTVCLVLLTVFGFAACGGDDVKQPISIWGKSFSYQNLFYDNLQNSGGTINEQGTPLETLIRQEFGKDNLDLAKATFLDNPLDLTGATTADMLMSIITEKAKTEMAKLSKWIVAFSEKDTAQVTFQAKDASDSITFTAEASTSAQSTYYSIKNTDGTFSSQFDSQARFNKGAYCISISFPPSIETNNSFAIKIPSTNIIHDLTAVKDEVDGVVVSTSLFVIFYPWLTLIEESSQTK